MKKRTRFLALLLSLVIALTLTLPAAAAEEAAAEQAEPAGAAVPAESTEPAEGEAPADPSETTGSMEGSIVLLYTNDVHGAIEGYASAAALRDYYEAQGASVLLLDAGDYLQGSPAVSSTQGENAITLMNAAGYDAAALGNHEFDYGYEALQKRIRTADFPILSANVYYKGEELGPPYARFQCGSLTVGVFGLLTPETAVKANPARLEGFTILDENLFDCAQNRVDEMKADGCDVIVCLGHLGIAAESMGHRSIDLLNRVKGIHIFIDGHSHSTLAEVQAATNASCTVNGTLLVSSGINLNNLGVVVIRPDGSTTASNIPVSALEETMGVTPDAAIAARAAAMQAKVDAAYGKVFARTETPLNGAASPGNRTEETNLGDLICDVMLWKTRQMKLDADAAVINGGGIRAEIKAGSITRKDMQAVLPFGNTLHVVQVTGEELRNTLEASAAFAPEPAGGFPQVAGIELVLNTGAPYARGEQYPDSTLCAPAQVNRVTVKTVGGEAFDPEKTYTIVTNDFLGAGGDSYYGFKASPIGYDLGVALDEAVTDYISTALQGRVTAKQYGEPQGRIRLLSYPDVLAVNWFNEAVQYVTFAGIMQGTDVGFQPNQTLDRATLVTVLYRMAGSPEITGENPFTDIPADQWYSDAVRWAAEAGVTAGLTEDTFGPRNQLTREQLATFLCRFARQQGQKVTEGGGDALSAFADGAQVQEYAVPSVAWAVEGGLLSGIGENLLSPQGTATRAQLATILMRYGAA